MPIPVRTSKQRSISAANIRRRSDAPDGCVLAGTFAQARLHRYPVPGRNRQAENRYSSGVAID
jgi:hypothetical protein